MFCFVLFNFRGKLGIVEVSACMWMCVCADYSPLWSCLFLAVECSTVCSWLLNVLLLYLCC